VEYLVHMLDYASFGSFGVGAGSHDELGVERLKLIWRGYLKPTVTTTARHCE